MTPDEIYATYDEKQILPQTAAPNPGEYMEHFKQFTDKGYEVVHISLGSGISSSHQHAKLAASELEGVYVIDSGNLSTGSGHLVIEAAERAEKGLGGSTIFAEIENLRNRVHASFVIDKLTYLREGGRCSALTVFSANLLNIRQVDRKSTRLNSSHVSISYAVFCLKQKKTECK